MAKKTKFEVALSDDEMETLLKHSVILRCSPRRLLNCLNAETLALLDRGEIVVTEASSPRAANLH